MQNRNKRYANHEISTSKHAALSSQDSYTPFLTSKKGARTPAECLFQRQKP